METFKNYSQISNLTQFDFQKLQSERPDDMLCCKLCSHLRIIASEIAAKKETGT